MIKKVTLFNFKRFREEIFDISDNIILAGPNNSGKTTLLQAIAVWHLALRKWLAERGPESGSKAKKYTGVQIIRSDFTAIPLREMNLLWTDCSTALSKDELQDAQKPGVPRILKIAVEGHSPAGEWSLDFDFNYQSSESIYVRPADESDINRIYDIIKDLQVVHVPPFSGIGAGETRYDREYQDLLIGQGKPGDILRNLLLEVHKNKRELWNKLCEVIEDIFEYRLLPPSYEGRPFILSEYQPKTPGKEKQKRLPKLDISCAGSGFLQVLMLLGFFYARPASILLLDEPDAHLHVVLQKQVYDLLREIAPRHSCQLIIATHSEVLIDGTSPERIVSFYRKPERLIADTQRDQVREALKRLTSLDLLLAKQSPGIVYLESETDLNLLREWAGVLEHPIHSYLKQPFWHNLQGRNPRDAKAHFFSLKAVKPKIRGVLILDGDNRQLPEQELSTEGLVILCWRRYEAESYLIHPEALSRFVISIPLDLFAPVSVEKGLGYLKDQLPPTVYNNPLSEHDYLVASPASKTLLPEFFKESGVSITKNEYYQVAAQMLPSEIPEEIKEKLDIIYDALNSNENT